MTALPATAPSAGEEGLYVDCVARGEGSRLLGPIGLDGQMAYTLGGGGLRAVVHNCRAVPYQSQDPQAIRDWAAAHQNVVLAATEAFGTVLPMGFDMIVRGPSAGGTADALRSWLEQRRDRFAQLLDRLAYKAEYAVQVSWDTEAIATALVQNDPELRAMRAEAAGQARGLAHLTLQKSAKAVREAMQRQADWFAQDFYGRIRACVEDVRVDKLKKAEDGRQMLLNLSCLMRRGSGKLGGVLEDIRRIDGISVRFTGPWPPYSFVGG